MSQMRLNFLNSFAPALPRPAILPFRSIPAVDARIVAIASIAAPTSQDSCRPSACPTRPGARWLRSTLGMRRASYGQPR
jgi:hypothetical protein